MKKEMLINVLQPEECRIAIVEDGILEELYVERTSHESYTGNIYKGKVVNLEPAIQAAFVDFSVGRNGFLHVSDVDPAYYRHLEGGRPPRDDRGYGRRDGGRGRRDDRPPRQEREHEERPVRLEREHAEAPRPAAPPLLPGEEREFGAAFEQRVAGMARRLGGQREGSYAMPRRPALSWTSKHGHRPFGIGAGSAGDHP